MTERKNLSPYLRFPEPMNTFLATFGIQLQFADGTTQDISSRGKFSTNVLPKDSWSATVNLPFNSPSSKVTVAVRAQTVFCTPGLDNSNQDLDSMGTGSLVVGSQDTTVQAWPGGISIRG